MKLSELRTDGGTQTRDALNGETVAEYAEKMRTGVRFPAVVAFYDGADYWLADGFHRVAGATQAGLADLDVDVRQGDRREAILFSVGANDSHGLRRTNADKRRAVNVLLADPVWVGWSDREIAKVCGVGKTLVGELRPSLAAATSEESTVTYTTKHGTEATMDTSKIGKRKTTYDVTTERDGAKTKIVLVDAAPPPGPEAPPAEESGELPKARRSNYDAERHEAVKRMTEEGMSTSAIASALGIPSPYVSQSKAKQGLTRRRGGWRQGPFASLLESADGSADRWTMAAENFKSEWDAATGNEKTEVTTEINRAIKAMRVFLNRLTNKAEGISK